MVFLCIFSFSSIGVFGFCFYVGLSPFSAYLSRAYWAFSRYSSSSVSCLILGRADLSVSPWVAYFPSVSAACPHTYASSSSSTILGRAFLSVTPCEA